MKPGALAVLMVLGFSTVASPAFAQGRDRDRDDNRDPDRVCFYRDVNFQGASWCYRPGDELADLRNQKNEISSIRVYGRARVRVYDQEEFSGASEEFDRDVTDLTLRVLEGRRNWNDRIDSFQVVAINRGFGFGRGRGRGGDRDERPSSRDRICIYEDVNFGGRSQCWDVDGEERNLSGSGWNDRVSSIRIYGRARVELYRDADYRGGRLRLDRDTPDLGAMNWDDQVSSFQVR
jgi:hypothetical protein